MFGVWDESSKYRAKNWIDVPCICCQLGTQNKQITHPCIRTCILLYTFSYIFNQDVTLVHHIQLSLVLTDIGFVSLCKNIFKEKDSCCSVLSCTIFDNVAVLMHAASGHIGGSFRATIKDLCTARKGVLSHASGTFVTLPGFRLH